MSKRGARRDHSPLRKNAADADVRKEWRRCSVRRHDLPRMNIKSGIRLLAEVEGSDTGAKERDYMKSRIQYTDEPMGDLKAVRDFLPSPETLVVREDTIKVTIGLSRSSVNFFKREARLHHTAYQKMIRRLLDLYASRYEPEEAPTAESRRRR